MELELSPRKYEVLLELLRHDLERLRRDGAHTHRATFRSELRVREDLMKELLAKLRSLTKRGQRSLREGVEAKAPLASQPLQT